MRVYAVVIKFGGERGYSTPLKTFACRRDAEAYAATLNGPDCYRHGVLDLNVTPRRKKTGGAALKTAGGE